MVSTRFLMVAWRCLELPEIAAGKIPKIFRNAFRKMFLGIKTLLIYRVSDVSSGCRGGNPDLGCKKGTDLFFINCMLFPGSAWSSMVNALTSLDCDFLGDKKGTDLFLFFISVDFEK